MYTAARHLAALSAEERIYRIRADRWISYPRAEAALVKLETLMSFPERARMPNLLIVGESGMGKTMIIEKFTRDHPANFDETTGRLHMPVVVVQIVSGPDESRFYRRILAATGAPEPPRATLAVLESLALRLLSELRPGMLVIDEIHSLQAGTIREQARFLNMLRFRGNELRVPLVCVSTAQACNALRTDVQLVRRFEAFALTLGIGRIVEDPVNRAIDVLLASDVDGQGWVQDVLRSWPLSLRRQISAQFWRVQRDEREREIAEKTTRRRQSHKLRAAQSHKYRYRIS